MAAMLLRNCLVTVLLIGVISMLAGCVYRLPAGTPPSQELIRIVSSIPEQYTLQVNAGTVNEYAVPHDGRVKIAVPAYRRSCGVYLLNFIKVGGYGDPLKSWSISVSHNGRTVRKLSLRAAEKLPTDDAGYRMVRFTD